MAVQLSAVGVVKYAGNYGGSGPSFSALPGDIAVDTVNQKIWERLVDGTWAEKLDAENVATTGSISFLSGEIDANSAEIAYLSGEIDANSAEIAYLSGEIDAISGESLSGTLALGNVTNGNDIVISNGDVIRSDGFFTNLNLHAYDDLILSADGPTNYVRVYSTGGLSANQDIESAETVKATQFTLPSQKSTPSEAYTIFANLGAELETTSPLRTVLAPASFTGRTEATATTGDWLLFSDTSNFGTVKKVDAALFLSGGGGGGPDLTDEVNYLSGEIDANSNEITFLSGEIDANSTDISSLSGAIDNNSSDITTLFGQDTTISAAVDNNTSNIGAISGDYVSLTQVQSVSGSKTFTTSATIEGSFVQHDPSLPNTATGIYSHAEGRQTSAIGLYSHAEGRQTNVISNFAHVEGYQTYSNGNYAHAEGHQTSAFGLGSHTEGFETYTIDDYAHAEGYQTRSEGFWSHAEGESTWTNGTGTHVEGRETSAGGSWAHAEGYKNFIGFVGNYAHAEGESTYAGGQASHSEGYVTSAYGNYSHTMGVGTFANLSGQVVAGLWNELSGTITSGVSGLELFVVGNGVGEDLTMMGNPPTLKYASNAFSVIDNGVITWGGRPTAHPFGPHPGIRHWGAMATEPYDGNIVIPDAEANGGDRYFNTTDQKEYIYSTLSGWVSIFPF